MSRSVVLGVLAAMLVAAPATAAPGVLDPGFGAGGIFTAPPTATLLDNQQQLAVDPQGRALLAITQDPTAGASGSAVTELVVARLTPAGALDATFNPGGPTPGLKTIDFGGEVAAGVAVTAAGIRPAPDGSIVALATVNGAPLAIGLVRLTSEGGYDPGFGGGDGHSVTAFTGTEFNAVPQGLLLDGSARILVAGTEASVNNKGFVARFTTAGVLDPSWDGDGIARVGGLFSAGPSVQLADLALTPDGGVVAGGQQDLAALAFKFTAAGAPDPAFGAGGAALSGLAQTGFPGARAFTVGVDGQGRVLLGGQTTVAGGGAGALARFTATGAPDPSWGPGGGVVVLPATLFARVSGLLIASGDRVVISGTGSSDRDEAGPALAQNAPSLGRASAGGVPDPAFGVGGGALTPVGVYANGGDVVADPVARRLLQVSARRRDAATNDIRPVVLAYGDDGSVAPGPVPSPGTSPPPAAAPPGAGAPAPRPPARRKALTFAQAVTLPSAKRCVSRRSFAIRLRVPKGADVTRATVTVDGKQVAVRKGARLRSTVNLRSLPKGRFVVVIRLRLGSGKSLTGKRAYRTCAPKRRGGKPKL